METLNSSGKYTKPPRGASVIRRFEINSQQKRESIANSPRCKPLIPTPPASPKTNRESNVSDNIKQSTTDNNDDIITLLNERTRSYDRREDIIDKINKRLDFGRNKYGHGMQIHDDTTQYSSKWDKCSAQNWLMMAYEEMLDGCIYFAAEIIRAENKKLNIKYITKMEKALKYCLKSTDLLLEAEDLRE